MQQVHFLSWNVYRDATASEKQLLYVDLLAELTKRGTDVVILQECFNENIRPLLIDYEEIESRGLKKIASPKGLRILLKRSSLISFGQVVRYQPHRVLGVKLRLQSGLTFNLIGLHLYSKVNRTAYEQNNRNREVPLLIQDFESANQSASTNTLVVGDFNHAPFEPIFADPLLFNALGDKSLIDLLSLRTYNGHDRPFFYNPMWNLVGDYDWVPSTSSPLASMKPSGSYYWQPPSADQHFWNLFDGLLLRPSIMNALVLPSLQLLTKLNFKTLLKQFPGKGWVRNGYSDHLPLVFTLDL